MSSFIKNALAIGFAITVAGMVSFFVIVLGHSIVPIPDGIDTNDFESIKSNFLASLSLSIRIGHFNWIGIIEIAQYIPLSILGFLFWKRTKPKVQ